MLSVLFFICNKNVDFYKDPFGHELLNASLCMNMRRVLCMKDQRAFCISLQYSRKLNVEDFIFDKMIDSPVKDATEWRESASQNWVLLTQKYEFLFSQKEYILLGRGISRRIEMQHWFEITCNYLVTRAIFNQSCQRVIVKD